MFGLLSLDNFEEVIFFGRALLPLMMRRGRLPSHGESKTLPRQS